MDTTTVIRPSQRTLTVNKTTTRETVYKLMQFRKTLENTALEEGTDLFNLSLSAGYVLLDVCEILGLDLVEAQAVMGEATAETVKACYHDNNTNPIQRQIFNDLVG